MAYIKTEWKDRIVEYPNRYTDQNGVVHILSPSPGIITEEGTPITAVDMNKLEEGVRHGVLASGTELGEENKLGYGVENVDDALRKAMPKSSYMAFCTNANVNSIDSAFGKNNEDLIFGLGLQLAMYAWFKGTSKVTSPFVKLTKKDNLQEIAGDAEALKELLSDTNLYTLITANPYASSILMSEATGLRIINSFTTLPQTTLSDVWITNKCMSDMYKKWQEVEACRLFDIPAVKASVDVAPNIVSGSRSVRYTDASTVITTPSFALLAQYSAYSNMCGFKPDGTSPIYMYDFASEIKKYTTGGSTSTYTLQWKYIPITLVG